MRLIEVARTLGMTGQELRRELTQMDFGVKPADREIPDQLAQGIIRYVASKHGIRVPERPLDDPACPDDVRIARQAAVGPGQARPDSDSGEETSEVAVLKPASGNGDERKEQPVATAAPGEAGMADRKVHVLRKLSLEGVSDADVRAQLMRQAASQPGQASLRPKRALSKAEREAFREEEKAQEQPRKKRVMVQEQIKRKEGIVELPETITVKEFAEKTGVQVPRVISVLMENGVLATINQTIDFGTAAIVASELEVQVRKEEARASAAGLFAGNLAELLREDDPSLLLPRAPIVTVMGHVDHGKTAILDAIRETDVASGEAGGITQKIGAYQVERGGKPVTFLDTPGHEAFTAMRARGAQITDIVVLVVAADEGVKPTTVEAIAHAKDAEVPVLVAINKIDVAGADPDRVKGELVKYDLQPEEWGGKTPVVLCSAKTGQGVADLLDHILILSEIAELRANPDRSAVATVIESHLDASFGPLASVVVNTGTLRTGDAFVCGVTSGRVKLLMDSGGLRVGRADPSGAVRIAGFADIPETGDILQVVADEREAKKILAEVVSLRERQQRRGIGDLISRLSEGKLTVLKVVLKADSVGSLEAIGDALLTLRGDTAVPTAVSRPGETGRIAAKIIYGAVGGITESDVMMAAASGGIVLGFNVALSSHVGRIARSHGVEVRLYDVIYALLDEVKGLLSGLVEPEEVERVLGRLEVRGVFFRKKSDQVVGGKVTEGTLKRVPFRLLRGAEGQEVGTGRITSLRHVEKDVKEAKEGQEYGLRADCETVILEGDVIEGYVREWKRRG